MESIIVWNCIFIKKKKEKIYIKQFNDISFILLLVAHHLCEQTPEQAEPGGYRAGISGNYYF